MPNKKRPYLLIILIVCVAMISGCSNNEYEKLSMDFNKIYMDIIKPLETSDIPLTLKRLHSDESKEKIEKLGLVLEKMKDKVPEDESDQMRFEIIVSDYNELVLLSNSYDKCDKWDELESEDKVEIWNALLSISINQ